ncbi:NADP-dependent oxidoreductase domain-containing protein [Thelephora terrestris]|uniref:NADP-dependent oxidoreductase domain-containing protein n=1 Tax=Thelephora terrestris TaxID=56493 RepID=A0A9P6L584_9AGAM|nr:NADP-dependent oxidoreductase domain-containing protein [Thelephora terrestris]
MLVFTVNFRGVLKATTWKPCAGFRKGSLHTKPKSHFTLPSGDTIPSVALGESAPDIASLTSHFILIYAPGVWQAGGRELGEAVKIALAAGYRHFDGAWAYRNEHDVGNAIVESGVPREDIFITSKLWNSFHAPEDIEASLDESLSRLRTSYLDLYLIHWPIAFKKEPYLNGRIEIDEALTADPYPTWKKLEELVDKGKIRNIGVSKYENLTSNPLKYRPAVNQVELSFGNPQPELLAWAKLHDVLLEAYSPLGSSRQVKETLELPIKIAKELGITPAQVIISWHVQRGVVVLPKSVHEGRIRENFEIVALPQEDFDLIERAAVSKAPQRVINPSKEWGLDYDIFA